MEGVIFGDTVVSEGATGRGLTVERRSCGQEEQGQLRQVRKKMFIP